MAGSAAVCCPDRLADEDLGCDDPAAAVLLAAPGCRTAADQPVVAVGNAIHKQRVGPHHAWPACLCKNPAGWRHMLEDVDAWLQQPASLVM